MVTYQAETGGYVDVTVKGSGKTRTYKFSEPINQTSFSWLKGNRNIESYDIQGQSLTVTAVKSESLDSLEHDFIMPGLNKAFGELNVKTHV